MYMYYIIILYYLIFYYYYIITIYMTYFDLSLLKYRIAHCRIYGHLRAYYDLESNEDISTKSLHSKH